MDCWWWILFWVADSQFSILNFQFEKKTMDNNRLYIFDTTLRDGEQVPGCQLNTVEKIQVAKQLEALGLLNSLFQLRISKDHKQVPEELRNLLKDSEGEHLNYLFGNK